MTLDASPPRRKVNVLPESLTLLLPNKHAPVLTVQRGQVQDSFFCQTDRETVCPSCRQKRPPQYAQTCFSRRPRRVLNGPQCPDRAIGPSGGLSVGYGFAQLSMTVLTQSNKKESLGEGCFLPLLTP